MEKVKFEMDFGRLQTFNIAIDSMRQSIGIINRNIEFLEKKIREGKLGAKIDIYKEQIQSLKEQKSNIIDSMEDMKSILTSASSWEIFDEYDKLVYSDDIQAEIENSVNENELEETGQLDIVKPQTVQKSSETMDVKTPQLDHINPMSTEKKEEVYAKKNQNNETTSSKIVNEDGQVKIDNIKMTYIHKTGYYVFSFDVIQNNKLERKTLRIKSKKKYLYDNSIRIKLYQKFKFNYEFCENIDLDVVSIVCFLGDQYGIGQDLLNDMYNGKLNIKVKYDFSEESNELDSKDTVLKINIARKQKSICDTEICHPDYIKYAKKASNELKIKVKNAAKEAKAAIDDNEKISKLRDQAKCVFKDVTKKHSRSKKSFEFKKLFKSKKFKKCLIPSAVASAICLVAGLGPKLWSNINSNNTNDISKNTNDTENNLNKSQSILNGVTNNENMQKTTENSSSREYMDEINDFLDYCNENYDEFDKEKSISEEMEKMLNPSRDEAAKRVAYKFKSEIKKIEENKNKEEIAKDEEIPITTGEIQIAQEDEQINEIGNKDTTLSMNTNKSINLSEITGYKIGDKISLNGKVLTGDSQGNGKKCYPDNFKCDYFEVSTIVVWNGSQVLDIIRQDKGEDDINTHDLYRKYGADIDIVFNFNGCFNDKPNRYENMGWINIDELSPLTIQQKQAIAESKDDTKSENKDDSVSIKEFYDELENELALNKKLSGYKLTFHM